MTRRRARALLLLPLCALLAWSDPPQAPSKKGLGVQMIDDALALGIAHATLNVQIGDVLAGAARDDDLIVARDGEEVRFAAAAAAALDRQIEPLAAAGVRVYLILLARATGDPALDPRILHPRHDPAFPNRLAAFHVESAEGRRTLGAFAAFLGARYGGKVAGYIVGNEVNSHWWWYNLGLAGLEEVADAYERAVRIVHDAVRGVGSEARVYVSLEHHWSARFAAGTEEQSLPGRALLERFAALARERGDFDWHVAFHPYPEDLFECRTWLDRSALPNFDTPRITFKNLEVLPRYLRQDELLCAGKPRRVILSEQGFHCAEREDGERDQAAAFAYAWMKVRDLDGVDAFILHRHVDHAEEGGLRLGLWTRKEGTLCTPERPRRMYEVFRSCDGPEAEEALCFALPVIGLKDWSEVLAGDEPAPARD